MAFKMGRNFATLAFRQSIACDAVLSHFAQVLGENTVAESCNTSSIQTAGLAFGGARLCSYCVRGVDGSCATHLAVESFTVVMLLTFILIISIPSPLTPSFQA